MSRAFWTLSIVALGGLAACRPEFQLKKFTTNEALYAASLRQFQRGKWGDAVTGFDKLSLELAPRDTLAAKSFWYLGLAHQHQRDYQLAAQAFNRIFESFPDDSLMDDALYQEGRSYQSMWTRPDRDGSFGDAALATYSSLMTYRPDSPFIDSAKTQIGVLQNMFAIKNYETGMYYFRDKAYDPAMISFKFVLEQWPDSPKAKDAALRLVEAYRAIRYKEEATETCTSLRAKYPSDAEVAKTCPAEVAAAKPAVVAPSAPPVKPPAAPPTHR